jgi:predicted porin
MKKHLIAAAVAAAVVAPAAMAQNVSIYGILDMNWSAVDTDGTAGTSSAMGSNALATSRLGFRGSEDLGGGLKAEFQLEGKLSPENGQLGATGTTSTANTMFDRESWVGLSGGFGAVRFGLSDVTSSVNIDSKVSQMGDLGLISELSTDKKKVIRYTTPNFNGFTAEVGYANPDSTTAANGETTVGKLKNLYAAYEKGPLGVYLGYENLNTTATYDQKQMNFGAKYDFGVVSVGAVYATRDGATAAANDFDQMVVSVAAPLGNGLKLHAGYEVYDTDNTATASDFKSITVALTKAMSKRTTLYAAFIDTDKELASEKDSKQYTVGIVHSF